jgi:BCD family chlorophyll transporter-like MFS transporter
VTPSFREAWSGFVEDGPALRRLLILGAGTMGFAMQDVLLEPYGGEVLGLSVGSTTALTALLAFGGLLGFGLASRLLGRGGAPERMAGAGALAGVPGFVLIILAGRFGAPVLLDAGVLLIGFGGGLFAHGTLTATMRHAPRDGIGLALGAWGAVQATAAGVAMALGGVLRDLATIDPTARAEGYAMVYALEVVLLLVTVAAMAPLLRRR